MKENNAGILHDIDLKIHTIYNIFTKAGNYRGGKIYDRDKYFTLLNGKAELTTFEGDKDIKREIKPGEITEIKSGIPNIFYFPEDTEMLEWFDKKAKAEKYERYYNLKK